MKQSQATIATRIRVNRRMAMRRQCKRYGKHGGSTREGNRMQDRNGDYTQGAFGADPGKEAK